MRPEIDMKKVRLALIGLFLFGIWIGASVQYIFDRETNQNQFTDGFNAGYRKGFDEGLHACRNPSDIYVQILCESVWGWEFLVKIRWGDRNAID